MRLPNHVISIKLDVLGGKIAELTENAEVVKAAVGEILCLHKDQIFNLKIKVPTNDNSADKLWVTFRLNAPRTDKSVLSTAAITRAVKSNFDDAQNSESSFEAILKRSNVDVSAIDMVTEQGTDFFPGDGGTQKPTAPPTNIIYENDGEDDGLSTGGVVAVSAVSFLAVVLSVSMVFVRRGKRKNTAKHRNLIKATTAGYGTADAGIVMTKPSVGGANVMVENPLTAGGSSRGGWESAVDPKSGKTYYFNRATGKRVWKKPQAMMV